MRKALKAVGIIAALLAIYFAAQLLVTFVVMLVQGIQMAMAAVASNTTPDIGVITDELTRAVGAQTPIVLLVAVAITLPMYYLIYRKRKQELGVFIGFGKLHPVGIPALLVLGLSLNFIIDMLLGLLNEVDYFKKIFESYSEVTNLIFGGSFVLSLIAVGIVGPVFEELLFRGLVFGELRKVMKVRLAIVIQALLFGLYHMNLIQGTYAFLIGLILGFVYYRSRSILAPILVHIAINSSSVIIGEFVSTEALGAWGGVIVTASIFLFILSGAFVLTHRSFRHTMDDGLYAENHAPPPDPSGNDVEIQ